MQSTDLQKNGRLLISRAGQLCYVKNKLLTKEGELLSSRRTVARSPSKGEERRKGNLQQDLNEEETEEKLQFMSPPAEQSEETKVADETRKVKTASSESPSRDRRTETRVYFLFNTMESIGTTTTKTVPAKPGKHATAYGKRNRPQLGAPQIKCRMDPYWSRVYSALKGDEFDAIAKRVQKNEKGSQRSPEKDVQSRPRTSWIPRSQSITALERAIIPAPIIKPRTTKFSQSPRKGAFCSPVPHDKRFTYNPRALGLDLLDKTRYKPFPVANFTNQLARDNRPFTVTMTPPTKLLNGTDSPSKVGIPFNKMMPRGATGDLFGNSPKRGSRSPHTGSVISSKELEKLSTCKRVITPSFKRFKSRYREGQLMPSFMENVNNRTSITSLCFEMLKANNYFETDLSPQISSCSPKKSFNRKAFSPLSSPSYKNYTPREKPQAFSGEDSLIPRTPHTGPSQFCQ